MSIENLSKELTKALKSQARKPKPYDTKGVVRRVENGIAYVHYNGSTIDETPVQLTIDAHVGDEVIVRSSGGRAFIVGNGTAPPTDDRKATEAIKRTEQLESSIKEIDGVIEKIYKGVDGLDTLIRESEIGIEVGKVNSEGEYVTGHVLIDARDNTYKVFDADGNVVATFGDEIVLGKDDVLRASTYETIVDTYADIYSGRGSASGVVFDLPYAISGTGIADIKEVSIKPHIYSPSGAITIIRNGSYVNGDNRNAYLLNRNHLVVLRSWFESYAPTWIPYIHTIKGFISTGIDEQSVDTASVRIGSCNPTSDYKLVTGTDSLDGSVGFSVDGDGVCDARGGFKVGGNPIIETVTNSISISNIQSGALGVADIPLTPPNGKTLIGIASWQVTGVTGSYVSQCQVRGVHCDGINPVAHIIYKNDGTNVGTDWTFKVTGIFV